MPLASRARSRLRSFALRALPLLTVAMLAGCSGGGQDTASMRQGPGYGQGSMMDLDPTRVANRTVSLIALTPQSVADLSSPVTSADEAWTYRLGVGDVLQLFVVNEPDLTQSTGYRVEADGTILVPYLGRVPVANRSAAEVRTLISDRLLQFMGQPQVDVRITAFNARHVAVVGDVRQPSRQTLTDQPLTAIDAINAAGGFSDDPDRANVVLIRNGVEQAVDVRGFLEFGRSLPVLRDGDVVRVEQTRGWGRAAASAPTNSAAALYHRAGRADPVALDRGPVTLAMVARSAGVSAADTAFVLRPNMADIHAYHMSAQDAVTPEMGGRFTLAPGDVITFVPALSTDPAALRSQLSPALNHLNRR